MDGELLWNTLYRAVTEVARRWNEPSPRRGHPDCYTLEEIALCWLWTAFWNQPLLTTCAQLRNTKYRAAMTMLGVRVPRCRAHETTLRRRSRRPDFQAFLHAVDHWLIRRLRPRTRCLLIDSTPLPVPHVSQDRDATWGHHRLRGYRWHTLTRSEIRGQRSEVRGQRSEIRGQRSERAYELAMRIFELTMRFPAEERFALTTQIRRSSRSICLNLREAWAKRRYPAAFVAKLSDCDAENSETDSALDFAVDCGYISRQEHAALTALAREIGRMLGAMIQQPRKFLLTSDL